MKFTFCNFAAKLTSPEVTVSETRVSFATTVSSTVYIAAVSFIFSVLKVPSFATLTVVPGPEPPVFGITVAFN